MNSKDTISTKLEPLKPVWKVVGPIVQKQGASYLADYLNQRREAKNEAKKKAEKQESSIVEIETNVDQSPQVSQASLVSQTSLVSQAPLRCPEVIVPKRSVWPMFASALFGSVLGVVAGVALVKQETVANFIEGLMGDKQENEF